MKKYAVPKPCRLGWEQMNGGDRVRTCQTCQHAVYNFSELTRREAQKLVESSQGNVCGVVSYNASGDVIFRPERPSAMSRLVRISLLGMTGWSSVAALTGQVCQVTLEATDGSGAGLKGARVAVTQNGLPIRDGNADDAGHCSMTLPEGQYAIQVSAPGFSQFLKERVDVTCAGSETVKIDAKLEVGLVGEVVDVDPLRLKSFGYRMRLIWFRLTHRFRELF
jgi:carboxypeptidase family protein